MTREIKFRAWDYAYDKMVMFPSLFELFDKYEHEPSRFVLQQFTGLLDKNGKEIFEGDIVYYNQGLSMGGVNSLGKYEIPRLMDGTRVVVWKDKGFEWDGSFAGLMFCKGGEDKFEVIGNIYENPELLK
jgi:uncharacterized phage protein (TIGR01671 family)